MLESMWNPLRQPALTFAVVVCVLNTSLVGRDGHTLAITATSPTMQPGSVVLLTVKSETALTDLTGQGFGRPVRFWQVEPLEWRGLIAARPNQAPTRSP